MPWQKNSHTMEKDSMAGDYLSARFAQKQNDSDQATRYFESALKKDPKNLNLLKKGYDLMLQAGMVEKAIDLAKRYSDGGGESPNATLLLALEKIKQKDFIGAEEILNKVTIKKVEDVGTTSELVMPLLKVWVVAGQGNHNKAIQMLASRESDGLESFVQYQMALLHDIAGNTKEAEELFDKLSMGVSKSLRLTEVATNFYNRSGSLEKAGVIVGNFIEQNSGITEEAFLYNKTPIIQNSMQGVSELLLEVASFLYNNRLDDMAQGYTNMSLYLTQDFPHAKLLMAKLLRGQKRYEEAIAALETITYPPYFHWQSRLNVARIYHTMKKHEKAQDILLAMSKQDPDDKDALLTLGDVLMDRDDYSGAVEIYSQALSRDNGGEKTDWIIFYARGIAYEKLDDWPKAEKDFFSALELKPNQPDVLNYLGYSWLIKNMNIDKAKEMLQTAIALRPSDSHIIDSYGWALYKIKDYQNAVKYLERSNLLMPHDVTTNDHLGDAYWQLGRINEAHFQWNRALVFDPEEEDRKRIESKIEFGLDGTTHASIDQEEDIQVEPSN